MDARAAAGAGAAKRARIWVESMGGPLLAVPVTELAAAADRVLADPATVWQDCGTWTTDGPAVLMDSANTGTELGTGYPDGRLPEQAPVPLPAGTWRVRAIHTKADELTWIGLVRLLPASQTA